MRTERIILYYCNNNFKIRMNTDTRVAVLKR